MKLALDHANLKARQRAGVMDGPLPPRRTKRAWRADPLMMQKTDFLPILIRIPRRSA